MDESLGAKLRELLAKKFAPISTDVNDMRGADNVEPVGSTDTVKTMSEGGAVEAPNDNTPHKAPEGPSDEEKRQLVMKALSEGRNMADGGLVDEDTEDNTPMTADAPQDSKLAAILKAMGLSQSGLVDSPLGKAASVAGPVIGALSNPVQAAIQAVGNHVPQIANTAIGGVNKVAGQNIPTIPTAPEAAPAPTPAPAAAAPAPEAPAPMPPAPPVAHAATAPSGHAAPNPLDQLGKFDPNSIAPGMNASDRQALAGSLNANQHTFGNYLAQALAGLGDAVSAKGGVQQNALGDIFNLQKQQRSEALDSFDKARQIAVEHFTMKNQADQNLIANLKAKGELQVSPDIAKALGRPELANKPVAQADLVLKTDAMKHDFANKMQERKAGALKNAAEEVDKALDHGGIFGTQKAMSAAQRLQMVHSQAIKNDPEAFGYSVSGGK